MTDSDIRTYRAASIHQALRMVEDDLGRDAVILHTRQIEQHRWLPWQKIQEEVEVTAGIGWPVASHSSTAAPTLPTPAPPMPFGIPDDVPFIPTSAYASKRPIAEPGEGVTQFTERMSWYKGPTFHGLLGTLQ